MKRIVVKNKGLTKVDIQLSLIAKTKKPTVTKEKTITDKVVHKNQKVAELSRLKKEKDVIIPIAELEELNPVVKNEAKVDVFEEISKEVNIEEDFFTVQLAAVSV